MVEGPTGRRADVSLRIGSRGLGQGPIEHDLTKLWGGTVTAETNRAAVWAYDETDAQQVVGADRLAAIPMEGPTLGKPRQAD